MRDADIPLEVSWNDIDYLKAYRNFEFDDNFSPEDLAAYVSHLKANHQHYVPIIDAAFAVPRNETDVYNAYELGKDLDVWMKNPDGSEYRGRVWPGVTVFWDPFNGENSQTFWTETIRNLSDAIGFSGLWLDMNEPSSFSEGSTGSDPAEVANVSTPFQLPGTPGNNASTFRFPECYDKSIGGLSGNITVGGRASCDNATQLAMVAQTNGYQTDKMMKRDSNGINYIPTPQVDIPAYDIHNGELQRETMIF